MQCNCSLIYNLSKLCVRKSKQLIKEFYWAVGCDKNQKKTLFHYLQYFFVPVVSKIFSIAFCLFQWYCFIFFVSNFLYEFSKKNLSCRSSNQKKSLVDPIQFFDIDLHVFCLEDSQVLWRISLSKYHCCQYRSYFVHQFVTDLTKNVRTVFNQEN